MHCVRLTEAGQTGQQYVLVERILAELVGPAINRRADMHRARIKLSIEHARREI